MTNIEINAAHALVELPNLVRENTAALLGIRDRLPAPDGEAKTLRNALEVEIEAIREKERFFWRGARPSLGAGAVALMLDGIASRLEIVCGFAPAPKGGLKPPAPLYADPLLSNPAACECREVMEAKEMAEEGKEAVRG